MDNLLRALLALLVGAWLALTVNMLAAAWLRRRVGHKPPTRSE